MITKAISHSLLSLTFCVLLTGVAAAQGMWTKKAPAPSFRSEVGVAQIAGKIYEVGGGTFADDGELSEYASPLLQEYNPATDTWRDLAPMPSGLSHPGTTALNGKLYVAGGFTIRPSRGAGGGHLGAVDRFYVYDPAANSWQTLTPLSAPLGSVGLVEAAGKIHVIGGRRPDQTVVGTHEIYDPATGKWTVAAPMPTARDHLGIVALDGRIHVIGGRGTDNLNLPVHEVFDLATGQWTQAAPIPTLRASAAAAAYRGLVIFAGGECKERIERKTFDENEAFDPKTGKWVTLAPLPVGLHAFGAAIIGDSLYFVGGTNGCGGARPAKEVLAFKLP